jgi:excisionase family DNA binding protein
MAQGCHDHRKGDRVPEPEKTFSAREAAERLGTNRRVVLRWIKKGRFPNVYKLDPFGVTSPYQIPESDLVAFEQERQESTAE